MKQFRTNNLATTPTILALNVKQFRMNYLPFSPQYWHKKLWSNLEQITWQLLLQLNVKQFKKKKLPLLPQYWYKNVKKFWANHLVAAATNINTKLWSNIEHRTWQVLTPILMQIVKQFITNNLATAPTILALNVKQFKMNYLPFYHNIDTAVWSNLEQI